MFKCYAIALSLVAFLPFRAHAQAKYTASRPGDLQLGVDFITGKSDYVQNLKGAGFYTTFDFTKHFGAEFEPNQGKMPIAQEYERTYEIGGRYYRNYGRLSPYAKAMYGRGVFNFPNGEANLAYNIFTVGAGADFRVMRYLNVRANYEYQSWHSFPPNGLTPQLLTFGVAYHFPGELARGKHF